MRGLGGVGSRKDKDAECEGDEKTVFQGALCVDGQAVEGSVVVEQEGKDFNPHEGYQTSGVAAHIGIVAVQTALDETKAVETHRHVTACEREDDAQHIDKIEGFGVTPEQIDVVEGEVNQSGTEEGRRVADVEQTEGNGFHR